MQLEKTEIIQQYPFDVQRLVECESSCTIGYFTKGHYPKADFLAEIQAEWDEDFDMPENEVLHHYAVLEADPDFESGFDGDEPFMIINDYKKPSGHEDEFPITLIQF